MRTGKRGEVAAVIAAGGHGTRGRRSHKMKQTQNAQAYSLAIGVAAEVTRESGEAGAFSLARAREGRQWLPIAVSRAGRENSETVAISARQEAIAFSRPI